MAKIFKAIVKQKIENQLVTVRIDKLDMNGIAISRWNKKSLFIQGALPNEVVGVKVFEQKNKYARAKLLSIKEKSESRVDPRCSHFSVCGGCDLQMMDFDQQIAFKQDKITALFSRSELGNKAQLRLPWQKPIIDTPYNYRRKARIGVQFNKNHEATIGFRQKATNQLTAIKSCPVLVNSLSDIFIALKTLLTQLTVKSAIGHIEVIHSDITDSDKKNTVVVRQLRRLNNHDIALWQDYATHHQWQVIIDNGKEYQPLLNDIEEKEQASRIMPLSYKLINGLNITFSPSDFIQVNHNINNAMIEQALSWLALSKQDKVLDLFCGLGNFSLALAQQALSVVGVEGVQTMVDKATINAKQNGLDNCEFFQADLNSDWLDQHWAMQHSFNTVLLDPARAGAEQAVTQIVTLKIPIILYVSCDPATLARDSQILTSKGYKICKISLIDMFSQTKHVETMVLFNR
jgi:23S rRNA (uracil1939-C5)-methyltransferase